MISDSFELQRQNPEKKKKKLCTALFKRAFFLTTCFAYDCTVRFDIFVTITQVTG